MPALGLAMLICYTDGIFEAANAAGEPWGMERLEETIRSQAGKPADELLQAIVAATQAWIGEAPVEDDWTLVVAERCA